MNAIGHAWALFEPSSEPGLARVIVYEMKPRRTRRPSTATRSLTRLSHWLWVVAFVVLVASGLQIFNAAPYLDASDKSNPARRVLAIGSPADGVGTTTIFGHTFVTTDWLG